MKNTNIKKASVTNVIYCSTKSFMHARDVTSYNDVTTVIALCRRPSSSIVEHADCVTVIDATDCEGIHNSV